MNKKKLICIAVTLALFIAGAVGIIIVNNILFYDTVVYVYSEGELYKTIYPRSDDDYEFTVTNSKGNVNTVCVKNSMVYVSDADCPDKICVRSQPIINGTLPIVCVPNGLIIKAEAVSNE